MPRPPFDGDYALGATWRYPSGGAHFAYDYECPIGTPLFAIDDGRILDCNDGVPNDTPGDPDYTNEPSNWILLGVRYRDRPVSIYYQHLSPGLEVHPGQVVNEGDLIAHSGDSGNSSGPHLHLAAMYGYQNEASRYIYMDNDGNNPYVIYPPDKLWKDGDVLDSDDKDWLQKNIERIVKQVVWGHDLQNPVNAGTESFHRAANRWQGRSVDVIAQACAETTLETLQAAGVVAGVDTKTLVAKIAKQVADRLEPTPPPDPAP